MKLLVAFLVAAMAFSAAVTEATLTHWPKPMLTWATEKSSVTSTPPRPFHRKFIKSLGGGGITTNGWKCSGSSGPGGATVVVTPSTPPSLPSPPPPATPELSPPENIPPPPPPEVDYPPPSPPENEDQPVPSPPENDYTSPSPPQNDYNPPGSDYTAPSPPQNDYSPPENESDRWRWCFGEQGAALKCHADIVASYFSGFFRADRACCDVIIKMRDECSDMVFSNFPDPFFGSAFQYTCHCTYN